MPKDKYTSFSELQGNEEDDAYQVYVQERASDILVMAPHGGRIELSTSEIVAALAAFAEVVRGSSVW